MERSAHLAVLSTTSLADPSAGRAVLDAVIQAHPDLTPLRFGNVEPLRGRASVPPDVDAFVKPWSTPFLWTHGRRSEGSLWFSGTAHDSVYISASRKLATDVLVPLLYRLVDLTLPAFASLYVLPPGDADNRERYNAVYPFTIGPTTHELRRSLPDIPWLTVFGPEYVELFRAEHLERTTAFSKQWLGAERFALQLTPAPPEGATEVEYHAARNAVRAHLGEEHFLVPDRPFANKRVPTFREPLSKGRLTTGWS